ncbi:MAG: bifunctional alpha,alpha-trehalose-phosphate synthase (UDP-forming)/trehalose-phosphatase [Candidatus Caenarcaniphilales bacterium]|nr:bifunctional alpha,alpha-trehalose-phosphate synthase (UDP-forming)/trehalose-phosphatase [Candidatus Caenarcaniphilales bacterium]
MTNPKKVIMVANRLPVNIRFTDQGVIYQSSPGGLATAARSLPEEYNCEWIGWPGELDFHKYNEKQIQTELNTQYGCEPIFLTRSQLNRYYYGMSNAVLWPIFHYLATHVDYKESDWECYVEVNELFAERVCTKLEQNPEIPVWIHDYQLCLMPGMVRLRFPKARIGFFLHTPFPSSEVFRTFPHREDLLQGLLGASLIGFHTYGYLRHFRSSVLRLLGIDCDLDSAQLPDGRRVQFGVFPIGVDAKAIAAAKNGDGINSKTLDLVDNIADARKIILSVDRLDYAKGLLRRLRGFKCFLERVPERACEYVLILIAVPSRTKIASYRKLKEDLEVLINEINESFEQYPHEPIAYHYNSYNFSDLIAFYNRSEIALVTPLCDGMNLVAKEFVAAKQDSGVLILSEFAGAACELGEAVIVNSWSPDHIADALEQAIAMPANEREKRMRAMNYKVHLNDIKRWASIFFRQLENSSVLDSYEKPFFLTVVERDQIITEYRAAKKKLLLLDFDGTLISFKKTPELAYPDQELLNLILRLAKTCEITIISGRSRENLESWFRELPVNLSAEHGLWIRLQGDQDWQKMLPNDFTLDWFSKVEEIMESYVLATPGSLIERKEVSIVWHHRAADPEFGQSQARELVVLLKNILQDIPVQVNSGKAIVEVRPITTNKGNIFHHLDLFKREYDLIYAFGDDETDEDLFRAGISRPQVITFKVGQGATNAQYRLHDVRAVRNLLAEL